MGGVGLFSPLITYQHFSIHHLSVKRTNINFNLYIYIYTYIHSKTRTKFGAWRSPRRNRTLDNTGLSLDRAVQFTGPGLL
jgi:hypothetical protein